MGNVVPFKGKGKRGRNRHPADDHEDTLLKCECGNVWFHAVITFQALEGGRHRPDSYQISNEKNQANVMCVKCHKRLVVP